MEHSDGYGLDAHCEHAAEIIKDMIGIEDCQVYMMVGGTPCNVTAIAASLRPYESVVALRTGQAYFHETDAVDATGHRVVALDGVNGKMSPELIDKAWGEYEDEHTPLPKMVYISQPKECGAIYSKTEMTAIRKNVLKRILYITVKMYPCSGGTDTVSPEQGYCT